MRYYDPNCGRFINQDPIGLAGGEHLYQFADNAFVWLDPLGWKGWTKNTVLGRTVYQNNSLFNPNRKSSWIDPITKQMKSGTNVERMLDGLAPIDKKGRPIQLHHATQVEVLPNGKRGSLIEITEYKHKKCSSILHFPPSFRNPNYPKHKSKTIPRYPSFRRDNNGNKTVLSDEFDAYRMSYWKIRAKDFI